MILETWLPYLSYLRSLRYCNETVFRCLCPLDISCHRVSSFDQCNLFICSLPRPQQLQGSKREQVEDASYHLFISLFKIALGCAHIPKEWALTLPEVMDGDTSVLRRLWNQFSLETNRALYPWYRSVPTLSFGHFFSQYWENHLKPSIWEGIDCAAVFLHHCSFCLEPEYWPDTSGLNSALLLRCLVIEIPSHTQSDQWC